MALKHNLRAFRRTLGYILLKSIFWGIYFIPFNWLKAFARILAKSGYFLFSKHRKLAMRSLDIAFEDKINIQEKKKIVQDSFRYMLEGAFELLYCGRHLKYVKRLVRVRGIENLNNALAKKRGVIAVTAHFGNFPVMQFKLACEGYEINSIIRRMRDPLANKFFLKKRNEWGVKTIYKEPRTACVSSSIKSLKNNEILFILLDQNFGTGGVFVNFFNRKAATATGPVILAQRTNAVILPMFIVHDHTGKHVLLIDKEVELTNTADKQETIQTNTQRLTDIIESYIRKYPAEWSWIHRRWKTQPEKV